MGRGELLIEEAGLSSVDGKWGYGGEDSDRLLGEDADCDR